MKKLIAASAALLLTLTACSSGSYNAPQIPEKAKPQPVAPPAAAPSCVDPDPLRSYAPSSGPLTDDRMAEIRTRKRLIAGVSADSLHLGARNPITGEIEGFDIDMVKAVAKAIFGKWEGHLELRVISSPQRIPALVNGSVDIVARNMTINCPRWKQIAFSAEYYRSGQKTLVPRDSTAKTVEELDGKTICAPAGSTSLDNLKKQNPNVIPVTADTDTGCLVLFQSGKAYGISGDDTVLAGDAAQDPYARVLTQRFSEEPYGLGINRENVGLVRFVNQVLEDIKANGEWMASYNKWLAPDLGPLKSAPAPVYNR
ncbi:glutamate ABC transporter substrate-binding protein [Kribbella sandramycini]|uniref:Glutamate ABC transporter substrate-binding protein n=1 Tax=Kribbella sandramycini TaxID=60450 RepID=A0A7Y4L0Q7_9ACTN|nr:glutamate ABC transporter substrate-binding protein [Kribbella sandramycini]MBB6564501.1 polar amino acid transport system substrate-binding protein [Kribbella sandramycini]NOL42205.1 glutamate ABC transporter substrate-binding protein [Kribbella sandramycini]